MNVNEADQLLGTLFVFLIAFLGLYVLAHYPRFLRHGQMVMTYMVVWIFFVGITRMLVFHELLTQLGGRIVNGLAALVPFMAMVIAYLLEEHYDRS